LASPVGWIRCPTVTAPIPKATPAKPAAAAIPIARWLAAAAVCLVLAVVDCRAVPGGLVCRASLVAQTAAWPDRDILTPATSPARPIQPAIRRALGTPTLGLATLGPAAQAAMLHN